MKIVVHVNPALRPLAGACAALDGVEAVAADTVEELAAALPGAQVLIVSNSTYGEEAAAAVRQHGQSVEWMQFTSIGLESFEKLGAPGHITVCNAAGLRSGAVAEHAMALLLTLSRRVVAIDRARPGKSWSELGAAAAGVSILAGRTLFCFGYGTIGREVARLARAFGMRVVAGNRSGSGDGTAEEVVSVAQLGHRLAEADAVVLCLPESDETRGIIDADALQRMKTTTLLVNVGRGSLLDSAALVAALGQDAIGGAALDVFETEPLPAGHPYWDVPGLVMTPHVGGNGGDTVRLLRDLVSAGRVRLRDGDLPQHVVRAGGSRG